MTGEFLTEPVHESPTLAVSEVRRVLSVTSIDVPEGIARLVTGEPLLPLSAVWPVCLLSRHPDRATAATRAIVEIQCERRMS
jgi:hypothetical protein